jgi:hypothetical protein
VADFQAYLGVTSAEKKPHLLHHLFKFGAVLGDEPFYVLLIAFIFVFQDQKAARLMSAILAHSNYVSLSLKEIFEIPRPASPPVVRLEHHHLEQHGFPSVHSTAAASVPFYLCFLMQNALLLPIALIWFLLTVSSRIYLGVHSFADISAGVAIGMLILTSHCSFAAMIDEALISSPFSPLILTSIVLLLVAMFPVAAKWSSSFGESIAGIGVSYGLFMSAWVDNWILQISPESPASISTSQMLSQMSFGLGLATLAKTFAQKNMVAVLKRILKIEDATQEALKRYQVEIPIKLVSYFSAGFVSSLILFVQRMLRP